MNGVNIDATLPVKKASRARRPDAQGFDEVRITTVPRFKSSGLSGDEWRISGFCQLLRKGKVIHEFSMANVENCAKALPFQIMRASDEFKMFYAGEGDFCDQEGCAEKATVIYRVKKKFCNEPYSHEAQEYKPEEAPIRMFCSKHSKRGDCAFDDADINYELISGEPKNPNDEDIKESAFGGVINLS